MKATVVRTGWLLGAAAVLGMAGVGIGARYAHLMVVEPGAQVAIGQLRPADALLLAAAGVPAGGYAAYFAIVEFGAAVVAVTTAALLFWTRPREPMAALVAVWLLSIPTALPLVVVLETAPGWSTLILAGRALFIGVLVPLLFLFPDGRCIPRWARWAIALWIAYTLLWLFLPAVRPPLAFGRGVSPRDLPIVLWVQGWIAAGVVAQVWRYFRVSTAVERLRTRWVVFGFAVFLMLAATGITLVAVGADSTNSQIFVWTRLVGPTLVLAGVVTLAVMVGVAVLRYHLWDIDILIRRTLTYTLLTGLLAAFFFGSVIVLQQVFISLTGQRSQLAVVLSTLGIAALFNPLRRRIQDSIDRRFYRRRYDAGQVVAQFARTARDETNLAALCGALTQVVEEALQPENLAIVLLPSPPSDRRVDANEGFSSVS